VRKYELDVWRSMGAACLQSARSAAHNVRSTAPGALHAVSKSSGLPETQQRAALHACAAVLCACATDSALRAGSPDAGNLQRRG